jgi:cell division protein FtsW
MSNKTPPHLATFHSSLAPSPDTKNHHHPPLLSLLSQPQQLAFFLRAAWNSWWRDTDKILLLSVFLILFFAFFVAINVISHIPNAPSARHTYFLILAPFIIISCSLFSTRTIITLSCFATPILILMLILAHTHVFGKEINGAFRAFFIPFINFPIQPAPLIAPFLCVFVSRLIAIWRFEKSHQSLLIAFALVLTVVFLIFLQPDGDTALFFFFYFLIALFFSGVPMIYLILPLIILSSSVAIFIASFPHALSRILSFIQTFISPPSKDSHAGIVERAILKGQFTGKSHLEKPIFIPEGHNDLVFASIIQQFGLFGSLATLLLFAALFFSSIRAISQLSQLFPVLASLSLLSSLILPGTIHMLSAVNILPTLGQPLPFMSTGGSSIIAFSVSLGFIIALLRQQNPSHSPPHYSHPINKISP